MAQQRYVITGFVIDEDTYDFKDVSTGNATTTESGFMSAADKLSLDDVVQAISNTYTKSETDAAIAQSTATVDEKLRKSVQYIGTTPIDTGIIVDNDNHTLKRVRLYNTALSMPSGSWVQVGTLASNTWVLDITGMFRISTDNQKAFFVGRYFDVRWDINTGIIYAMQNYSSSTITVSVNLSVDYF